MAALRTIAVPGAPRALEALGEPLGARRALGQEIEAADDAPSTEGDQPDPLALARCPALGVAGGDVEMHAPRLRPVEHHAPVHLEEREVRADEDDVIGGVLDLELDGRPARVEDDRARAEQDLARRHRAAPGGAIAPSTWRTRMPSPKRHSIFTEPTSSGTPSSTSSVVRMRPP